MSIVNFLYNPDRKGKQQLIAEFVVRQQVLKEIMDDLESSSMKSPEQHYLIIGQRGTGKTTLLNRIKYAIEDTDSLKDWLIPIVFSEEQYNISELANLWENIAQVLEDYYGFDGIYEEMERYLGRKNFEEMCWDILERGLDEAGKKIVLLIDNIGDFFKKIDEIEVRRFREILQTRPQLRVIAASPLYLESLLDYKQPMFEFFKVIRLESLDSRDTRDLLLKLAEIHKEDERIGKVIRETPERIEVLRILTGGVPRTIAMMFNIFIEHEHESSLKDLENILDAVTPLYKHRMDDLPQQQQRIVDAVAKNWDPIGVKQLKEKVRLESKVISAQLRQLEKNQVVQKMETGGKNHEYILKERFFNIWYLMRYGRKDDRQRVIWLMRFLESWCTDEELEQRVRDFVELIKQKGNDIGDLEVFAHVYTSIPKLKSEVKFLLDENLPAFRENIQYNKEEISKIKKKKFEKNEYGEVLRLISLQDEMALEDKLMLLVMIKIDLETGDEYKTAKIISGLYKKMLLDGEYQVSVIQLNLVGIILYSSIDIILEAEHDELDSSIKSMRRQLEAVASYLSPLSVVDLFKELNFELKIILEGIKTLLAKQQYHSVLKIIALGESERKKNELKFSEIFNPIYLALISMDPGGKKVNIAPEKEEIVRQIRDFLMEK